MKVGQFKSTEQQAALFPNERLLKSVGAARSWVGDFYEELLADLTGARRIKTSGAADICPDLRHDPTDRYFEAKGVGRSGQGIIYHGRHEKYQDFQTDNRTQVVHWFFRHTFDVGKAETIEQLYAGLAASTFAVYMVDWDLLCAVIQTRPLRQVNSGYGLKGQRNGYGNQEKGYGIGWVFPISEFAKRSQPLGPRFGAVAHGHASAFRVYAPDRHLIHYVRK